MTTLHCINGGGQATKSARKPVLRVVDDKPAPRKPAARPRVNPAVYALRPRADADENATRKEPREVSYITDGELRGLAYVRIASVSDEEFADDTKKLWLCDRLSEWERNFVRGVREYHARNGRITDKQWGLVDKLCSEHLRKRKRQK